MAEVPPSPGNPPAEASASGHGSNSRGCEGFQTLDEFAEYKNGVGGQRRGKPLSHEELVREFEKHKRKTTQANEDQRANDVLLDQLWQDFTTTLERECEEHNLEFETAKRWYCLGKSSHSKSYTYQREFKHRDEMESKLNTGSISRDDPLLSEDKLGWPEDMPIEAYICSEYVKKGRHSGKPGSSCHVSAKNAIPGYQLLMGRKPDNEERLSKEWIAYAKNLGKWKNRFREQFGKSHDELTKDCIHPKKKAQAEQTIAALKAFLEKDPDPSDNAPMYEYDPIPWEEMSKLKASTDAFHKWVYNNDARSGGQKKAANFRNTTARQKKEADGERSSRQREPPRRTTKRKVSEDLDGIKLTSKQPGLSRLKVSLTPGEHAPLEEYDSLTKIVEVLFAVAKGEYRASMEVLYTLVNHLQNSPALVFSNTHVDIEQGFITYDTPNGTRFRSMDDNVSFLDDEIRADLEQAATHKTKVVSRYEHAGSGPNADEKLYLVYSVNGHEHRVAPYAAVFNAVHCVVDLKIDLLHKFYPEIYDDIRTILLSWHEDYESQNGGVCASAERSRMPTDRVFGGGESFAMLAACPPLVSSASASDRKSTYRVRRRRWHEMEANGGTLPETGFPLVVECKIYGLRGWMLWTAGSMWMRDKEDRTGQWQKMQVDATGTLRPPWWMEGDDEPEEAHDYASVVDGEMMPDQMPLLPSLF